MPGWSDILAEIVKAGPDNIDAVRHKYMANLAAYRGRNVIAYYSGWLQKHGSPNLSIDDGDKNGFMATIYKMDRTKGLDLILHTPGGDIPFNPAFRMYDYTFEPEAGYVYKLEWKP